MNQLIGTSFTETGAVAQDSTFLPLEDDPSIFFKNMTFCFTGRFIYGTRANCERIILALGSLPVDRVTKKLHYLVIGTLIEPSWAQTNYGNKIRDAIKHRDSGSEICIVSEKHWTHALNDIARFANK